MLSGALFIGVNDEETDRDRDNNKDKEEVVGWQGVSITPTDGSTLLTGDESSRSQR